MTTTHLDNGLHSVIRDVTTAAVAETLARIESRELVPPEYATPKQLAQITGVPLKTWEAWRARAYGPRFIRLTDGPRARVLYRLAEVRQWLAEHETDPNA